MFLILVGTRAQLIKLAPVMQELENRYIPFKFILTGQHKETIDDLISCFNIRQPDDVLVENTESDSILKLAIWLFKATISSISKPYLKDNVSAIIVHGDTLSALFGALLGYIKKIPVAHIEAGLRSFNNLDPFPEEIIRLCVSRLASVHYCPGEWACRNLQPGRGTIVNTFENTLLDATFYAFENDKPENRDEKYAIVSIHRHENINNEKRLNYLIESMIRLSERIRIKFVLHPVTRKKLQSSAYMSRLNNSGSIELLERMDYIRFIRLLCGARVILTDGGSNQEEAFYLKIPCVLLRKHTERREGLGENVLLSGLDYNRIENFVRENIEADRKNPVNHFHVSKLIVDHLENYFSDTSNL